MQICAGIGLPAERPQFRRNRNARAAPSIVQKRPAVPRLTTRRVRPEKSARGLCSPPRRLPRQRRRRAMRARAACSLAQNERGASPLRMQRARRTTQLHRNPDRSSLPPNDPSRPSADLPPAGRLRRTARERGGKAERGGLRLAIARLLRKQAVRACCMEMNTCATTLLRSAGTFPLGGRTNERFFLFFLMEAEHETVVAQFEPRCSTNNRLFRLIRRHFHYKHTVQLRCSL